MSYSSDYLREFETVRGEGQFVRDIESVDHHQNPATLLALRSLKRVAEIGDKPAERITDTIVGLAETVFSVDGKLAAHSYWHSEGLSLGGTQLPFLPGWQLHIDLYAPDEVWPITSLEPVEKIEFTLLPEPEHEYDTPPYIDDLLCSLRPMVIFTRNMYDEWTYDPINSSFELKDQTEVLDFVTGLKEGSTAPQ